MIEAFQFWPFLLGYLLGAIPFGLVLVRALGKGDIRATGSGNIGATNAVRAAGKKVGALVFLLDALKGAAAVLLVRLYMGEQAELFAAAGALIGHLYPAWLRFRGGKGVATLFGILFALDPGFGAIALGVWVTAFLVTRMSSAGGLLAALSAPIAALVLDRPDLFNLLLGITLLIWWKHRANIARIAKGSEPRFGAKKDTAPGDQPSRSS
ncbi:glycerol-3-phosphate 1-O-acyltransferase PlsY [Sphingomicrobium astaxanthinifaciens]|uniref:glycerol-3-phosphate 1-O-acyltransferase PlsY n=1 Tax=Sphingomicrobium astaxanthinifaciens TaxID=1227949 RepID=UPI001FCA64D5|nr:glycerol-3-phosphate 1-O-acyltransferase PlsY [Sphingomicrobium astaxanthinifaciens]MCJ7422102.1 glycerol-3-phosphate 1-O-acyltransferase PlsY [Sphingomicrobium astaxanthinifaciens]